MMRRSSHQSLSLRPWVCHPKTRAHVRLLGPCFKTGQLKPCRQHPERVCAPRLCQPRSPRHCMQSRKAAANRATLAKNTLLASIQAAAKPQGHPEVHPRAVSRSTKPMLARATHKYTGALTPTDCGLRTANFNRFPFNGFTYCLTLFSKCFSSFPHGTCSLSVSCPYLALDEIYHPFWAAFPSNPTLRKCLVEQARRSRTGLSPSLATCSNALGPAALTDDTSKLQFAWVTPGDFKFELFPLHSPLLRES